MPLIVLPPSLLLSISYGDTPEVKMGVRLLGIDAPELHFPLGSSPESQDPVFAKLPKVKVYKNLPQALRDYLAPRLEGAGTRQKKWGLQAKAAFEAFVKDGLAIPGKTAKRELFMACGAEVLDRYGRILAYIGPCVPKAERGGAPPPSTFNLLMLQGGWAAPCIHKDNLPKKADQKLVVSAVQSARTKKLGFWAEADLILHGYEFRSLVRLASGEKGFTYLVHDLRTFGKKPPLPPEEYIFIPDEYRVFE